MATFAEFEDVFTEIMRIARAKWDGEELSEQDKLFLQSSHEVGVISPDSIDELVGILMRTLDAQAQKLGLPRGAGRG